MTQKVPNPNKTVVRGAHRIDWRLQPHEEKAYAKHSNVYGSQLDGRVQADIAKQPHVKSDAMRLAAVVPDPPTDHYANMVLKWGLNDQDPLQKRTNWIKFLKSTDGAPYRVIPKDKV